MLDAEIRKKFVAFNNIKIDFSESFRKTLVASERPYKYKSEEGFFGKTVVLDLK